MFNIKLHSVETQVVNNKEVRVLTGLVDGLMLDSNEQRLAAALKAVEDAGMDHSSVILASVSPLGDGRFVSAFVSQWFSADTNTLVFGIGRSASKATIAHEMEHVRQLAAGEMETNTNGDVIWKGVVYKDVPSVGDLQRTAEYLNLPWEVEAFKAQHRHTAIGKYLPFDLWYAAMYKLPYKLAASIASIAKK